MSVACDYTTKVASACGNGVVQQRHVQTRLVHAADLAQGAVGDPLLTLRPHVRDLGGGRQSDQARRKSPSPPLHLGQRRLGLGQPEGHVHGVVQRHGGIHLGTGLLALASRGVQGAEAAVAVRLEGAHAEFLG